MFPQRSHFYTRLHIQTRAKEEAKLRGSPYSTKLFFWSISYIEIDTYWIWWKGDFTVEESENRGAYLSGSSRVLLICFPPATENRRKGKEEHWFEEGVARAQSSHPISIHSRRWWHIYISSPFRIRSSDLIKERYIYLLGRHSNCCKHFVIFQI